MSMLPSSKAISILVCALGAAAIFAGGATAQDSHPLVSRAQYESWKTELSNWNRWGPNDEMGTLNLITPAKRKAALALAKDGVAVSLSGDYTTEKAVDIPCPMQWKMSSAGKSGSTDAVAFPCVHGGATTHIDSLAHRFFDGKMWNGYDGQALVTMEKGASKNSVLTMKNGIITRGVLYDIARLKNKPYLEPGERIYPEDMEAWEKKTGARVGPGDVLVLRWGRYARRAKLGPDTGFAGFDESILPWLKKRDVAMVVWETNGYFPFPAGDDFGQNSVHDMIQITMGTHILDRADLEALADAAAARKRWEFTFIATPLAIPSGTGITDQSDRDFLSARRLKHPGETC